MGGSPYDPSRVRGVGAVLAITGIALVGALPLASSEELDASSSPARVEVLEGRAKVALPEGVLNLSAGAPVQRFAEALHFEQAPQSRSRIGWSSVASLVVEGRVVLEWAPPDAAGMPLSWTFSEVDSASLEVRRGRVRIEFAGGWRGALQPGAYSLRGLAGGSVEFQHAAGLPVTLWPPPAEGEPLPPYTVLPGAAVRLLAEARRPLALPGAAEEIQEPHAKLGFEARPQDAIFPSWRDFTWPWKGSERPSVEAGAQADAQVMHGPLGERLEAPTPPAKREVASSEGVQPAAAPEAELPAPIVGFASEGDQSTSHAMPPAEDGDSPAGEASSAQAPTPGEPVPAETPAARTWREMRRKGRLVLSPYGPRWIEAAPKEAPSPAAPGSSPQS